MEQLQADVVVAGGGLAGVCAALAAARQGADVILLTSRPVLGGNSSSEIRVWTRGATGAGSLFAEEMGILGELKLRNQYMNPDSNSILWDEVLLEAVLGQPGLRLFLNTTVTETLCTAHTVQALRAFQTDSQRALEIRGGMFIDCTGDSLLGMQADVPYFFGEGVYRGGAENDSTAACTLQGCSILYYVKRTDHPVPFVAPDFAYPIEAIEKLVGKGGRILSERTNASDCWWFEYGGLRNTIADSQEIYLELNALVMGIWNYIKNSGKFDADCVTLEWLGCLPGKRESRRMRTCHVVTGQEIQDRAAYPDTAFYGGWYMDQHPAAGIHAAEDNCIQTPVLVYPLPLSCLYAAEKENLWFAGRNIGTDRDAFASTRVMNTCALAGQAAGTAAALCLRAGVGTGGLTPALVGQIQTALDRADMLLPGRTAADPADLAGAARATASSADDGAAKAGSGRLGLEKGGWAVMPAAPDSRCTLHLHAAAPCTLTAEWSAAPLPSRLVHTPVLRTDILTLAAGENALALAQPAGEGFFQLRFAPQSAAALVLADRARPGFLCGTEDSVVYRDPFVEMDAGALYGPAGLKGPASRPWGAPNLWRSAAEPEPWAMLAWNTPQTIGRVQLWFDPDLSRELTSSHTDHWDEAHKFAARSGMPAQLVRNFRLEACRDGVWQTLARVQDNWRRLYALALEAPVTADALRVTVTRTWGEAHAHICRLAAYRR